MAELRTLTLTEGNDEAVSITARVDGEVYDLTGKTLEMYIKTDANQDDDDADLLSSGGGEIVATDADGGVAEVSIPGEMLTTDKTFWRYDVVDSGARHTILYGPLHLNNV